MTPDRLISCTCAAGTNADIDLNLSEDGSATLTCSECSRSVGAPTHGEAVAAWNRMNGAPA